MLLSRDAQSRRAADLAGASHLPALLAYRWKTKTAGKLVPPEQMTEQSNALEEPILRLFYGVT